MKIALLLIPLLLLSGCGKTEGLSAVPLGGYLPADVEIDALNEVISYENLNRYGEQIKMITAIENRKYELRLRVVTGDVENIFTLNKRSGHWEIEEVA